MYHSLIISGRNTYENWEMYPTSRPFVSPPEVKTNYIDIPGIDGGIDFTESLTGKAQYGYRKGSWEFMLIPQSDWARVYRDLTNFLHGKIHTVVLEDDPDYQYTGRLSINAWRSEQHNSKIVINYVLDPIPEDISGREPVDEDYLAAERYLHRVWNKDKALTLVNNVMTLVDYVDGDSIYY